MTVGEIIRKLRESRGLSQRALAERLNVSAGAIGMYESNRRVPDREILVRMADFFGVSVDYLMGREKSPTPLLDEADVAFANKLREISLEDRLIIERILENAIARQQREEEERRKREAEESGAT